MGGKKTDKLKLIRRIRAELTATLHIILYSPYRAYMEQVLKERDSNG